MTTNQMNRKHMIEATLNYLDEHAAKWESIAKLAATKTQLSQINEAIDEAAKAQSDANVTPGKTKLSLKKAIATKADILNDIVEVYATFEGDDELARQMGDSKTALFQMTYDALLIKVQHVIEKALKLQDTLIKDYGMTEAQVTDLKNDVDQLLAISGKPRAYQVKSSVATQELESLFSQASDLLSNQLDKLISIFKNRDANFYNGYQKARVVVD